MKLFARAKRILRGSWVGEVIGLRRFKCWRPSIDVGSEQTVSILKLVHAERWNAGAWTHKSLP